MPRRNYVTNTYLQWTMTDEQIVSLATGKDLKRFASKLCPNVGDAEELVQQTVLCICEKRDSYVEGNLIGWAFSIMYHIFVNQWRKVDMLVLCEDFYLYSGDYQPYYKPDLTESIQRLPDLHKEVFLWYAQGYTYEEISKKLNLPMGTVKTRLFNAKRKLQKYLNE